MRTIVNAEKLWIAAQFMSTEQTRYYLCGVFVEPCETGITLTATDGHRLVTCHADGVCDKAMIIHLDKPTITALKKGTTVVIDQDGQLGINKDDATIHIQPGNCEIDGTYPDWRRVIPSGDPSNEIHGFNAKYLGAFAAMYGFSKIRETAITVYQNGAGPAIVSNGDPDIFAVLMPTRMDSSSAIPAWISGSTETENAA